MDKKRLVEVIIVLLSLWFLTPLFAETIVLKSGREIEGKIIERTDEYIKIEPYGISAQITYSFKDIERIVEEKAFQEQSPLTLKKEEADDETIAKVVFAESDIVETFKAFWEETRACSNYDEYLQVNRKYSTSDKVNEMDSPEMKALPQEFKEGLFNMVKPPFDFSEIEIKSKEASGDAAILIFGCKDHPEFKGKATLIEEKGKWKIEQVEHKGSVEQYDIKKFPKTTLDKGDAEWKKVEKAEQKEGTIEQYDINNLPIPDYMTEVQNKIDFSENEHYAYIKDWRYGLHQLDMGSRMSRIQNYQFRQFTSSKHPRGIYLYYMKEFYNKIEGPKSRSLSHFDVENEGDSSFAPEASEDDVYYVINFTVGTKHFDIAIFRLASMAKTTIYIFSY